jgi:YesN/AraC family two-component response regulator
MSHITVFSGTFCKVELVVQKILKKTGFHLVTDLDLISSASEISGLAQEKIERAFSAKPSVFNTFTHEKERSIASLRLALAQRLSKENLIIVGFSGLLVPREVTHVLHTCLIAAYPFRKAMAEKESNLDEKEAIKLIHKEDMERAKWVETLFGKKDPWNPSLYDVVIPMDKRNEDEAAALILDSVNKEAVKPSEKSMKAMDDFVLSARVALVLAKEGHNVAVTAKNGNVTLTINKHVLMLNRLEEELMAITEKVDGVKSVKTGVGTGFYQTDIYRKYDFKVPSKVLLVDDEREFVESLSERLIMRQMGSAVAYDGESALELINEDEPEVMILDLKMPGIDGIEVLRRVKATRPDIEIIILTGHGSEEDREVCMKLGAFAYLNKPVDIDLLSETLKKANEKIRKKKV